MLRIDLEVTVAKYYFKLLNTLCPDYCSLFWSIKQIGATANFLSSLLHQSQPHQISILYKPLLFGSFFPFIKQNLFSPACFTKSRFEEWGKTQGYRLVGGQRSTFI